MNEPGSRWVRAASFARPYRGAIGVILALTLLVGAASALEPLLLGLVFDALSPGRGRDLAGWILALAGLELAREALNGVNNWLTWRTRIGIQQDLLDATVGRLQRLPLRYHRDHGVGRVMTRVDRGIQGFVAAIGELAFNAFPAVVYLVTSIVVMVQLDPRLTLVVLAFVPLPAVVGVLAAPEQTRRERDLLERWSRIYSRFNEVLQGIVTVRSFGMEDAERRRFMREVEATNDVVVRGVGTDSRVGVLRNALVAGARLAAVGTGALFVLRGEITAGTVLTFTGYVAGLFGPVQGLTGIYQNVRKASVSLDAVFDILDVPEDPADRPDAHAPRRVRGRVRFEGVHFRYDRDDPREALRGVDLDVRAGERVALVGPSGSGKTTLVSLLQRLYDPTEGRILLDGEDLRALDQRALRRQIGVVLQDGVLFNDTVRANIAYGRPDADIDEIVAAARAAHADAFVRQLPQGYDTVLGERGNLLSVGQRQRIAIARALLKDPPLLVLDEATSALDAESEAQVQEALDRLLEGRTSFTIAHRLATVVRSDRILVVRGGRIVEEGTHAELVRRGGYYAGLVRRQVEGLIAA